ncbi:flagellar hook-basal body protein FliE [Fulvimarina pelagi HTCC2506]|uniref:Flagellar hook-basal body complex protein FliE n=1 Tax=Fulvimarina pelagi HTCC2506 TaxID=314231 RepID=Q0G0Z7_9HYPH|nr:flagellar hook-basal body complex protein FliE [Fulvimarina pelagi]EAU40842.1 flagellar hook-basal body protein FliE [Fulvimarina pelagi HTCC2506]
MIPAIGSSLFDSTVTQTQAPSASEGMAQVSRTQPTQFNEFSEVLSRVMVDAADTVKTAEATSIQGVNGKASTQAVVEAVMSAERTLQTAVAVRDKAVAAYMELSRMQI